MAIKKLRRLTLDFDMLVACFEKEIHTLSRAELIKWCKTVVVLLSKLSIPQELGTIFYVRLNNVEYKLRNVILEVENENTRLEMVTALFKNTLFILQKATLKTSPAISIALNLAEHLDCEPLLQSVAADLFFDPGEWEGTSKENHASCSSSEKYSDRETSLYTVLTTMCRWLCCYQGPHCLHKWIILLMNMLENAERFQKVLADVHLNVVVDLLNAHKNQFQREGINSVFLHILSTTRDSYNVLQRISEIAPSMFTYLASESEPGDRPRYEKTIRALAVLLKRNPTHAKTYGRIFNDHCMNSLNSGTTVFFKEDRPPMVMRKYVISACRQPRVGLKNTGNVCYVNSVIQALFMTKLFSNSVVLSRCNFPLIQKLKLLFLHLMFSETPVVSPQELIQYFTPNVFTRGSQQDTSEFIGYLFARMHELEDQMAFKTPDNHIGGCQYTITTEETSWNSTPHCSTSNASEKSGRKRLPSEYDLSNLEVPEKRRRRISSNALTTSNPSYFTSTKTIVQKVFSGVLNTSIRCLKCNSDSHKNDSFWDLQLSFPEGNQDHNYSISQLLDYYFSKEQLNGDNRYHCAKCESLQDAERSVSIETAPKNLIIVLKQFYFDAKRSLRTKLFHPVKLNRLIKLDERNQARNYEIYAVIVHSGADIDDGHYFTIARDGPDDWYIFNDAIVEQCSEQTIYNITEPSTPYIIFYKRIDNNSGSGSNIGSYSNEFNPDEFHVPFSYLPKELACLIKQPRMMILKKIRVEYSKPLVEQISEDSGSEEDEPGASK